MLACCNSQSSFVVDCYFVVAFNGSRLMSSIEATNDNRHSIRSLIVWQTLLLFNVVLFFIFILFLESITFSLSSVCCCAFLAHSPLLYNLCGCGLLSSEKVVIIQTRWTTDHCGEQCKLSFAYFDGFLVWFRDTREKIAIIKITFQSKIFDLSIITRCLFERYHYSETIAYLAHNLFFFGIRCVSIMT